jgi:hypothetical protein
MSSHSRQGFLLYLVERCLSWGSMGAARVVPVKRRMRACVNLILVVCGVDLESLRLCVVRSRMVV